MDKEYLGDGVYVQKDDEGDLVLTVGSHELRQADETIFLSREVSEKLVKFINTVYKQP